jgi:outer membrane protein assembly factor BamB/precorrin-6B methylase 2
LNSTTGAELWRKSYPKDFGDANPAWGYCDNPLVDGDRLICTPGSSDVAAAMLNKLNGEVIWKVPVPGISRGIYGAIVPMEVDGVRQYVIPANTGIHGVAAADGMLLWSYAKEPGVPFIESVRIKENEVLMGGQRGVALLKVAKGESSFEVHEQFVRSDLRLNGFQDNLLAVDDRIYTLSTGSLVCLSRTTGETLWEHEISTIPAQRSLSTPTSRRLRRRTLATLVYADGHLVIRDINGLISLVQASTTKYVQTGGFNIPEHQPTQGVTMPVIAGGRLYLRDDDRLFCYNVLDEPTDRKLPPRKIVLTAFESPASRATIKDGPFRSVFVSTPQDVVERMLELAEVKQSDIVYDLGSGDGRILITAAKKYGCRAVGYEIDEQLVKLSRSNAEEAGVVQLVTIKQQDLFAADLSDANLVVLYLLPEQLKALVPRLAKLRPGTRIVSHQFAIPGISGQEVMTLTSEEDGNEHKIYLWKAPVDTLQVKKE